MFNLIWTIFICIKIRTECQIKVISGIHMYPKCGKNWSLALLFFQSFDCYFFFILDDYTYKISMSLMFSFWSLKQTYLRHPGFQELLQAVYISGTASCHTGQWIHHSISCFVNFLCVQMFNIYRLLFRQIVLHLTLNMFTCVIYSLTEERGLFLCDNYLCDKACIYNLPFKTNSL